MVNNMIILVGASASGKTEIAKVLIEQYNYKKCITTTTREKRVGEVDGHSYHFVSKEQFKELLNKDSFVENETYQNEHYGTQKKDLAKEGVIILEPNGANSLYKYLHDEAFIVLIESSKELRRKRMINRGDLPNKIKQRLEKDDQIFNKDNLLKLNLLLENCNQTLEELALIIHNKYNEYLNK